MLNFATQTRVEGRNHKNKGEDYKYYVAELSTLSMHESLSDEIYSFLISVGGSLLARLSALDYER